MRRTRGLRAATAGVLIVVAVSLCGCATAASNPSGADAAEADIIAERASVVGIAPELVYTTAVAGYDLAPQSVGPGAADGMTATWFDNTTGAMLTIRTDRGELDAASCTSMPLWDAPDATVTCTDEGGVWHRSGGNAQEYVATLGEAVIRVTGTNDPPQADLQAAAKAVHVPSEAELALLFSDLPTESAEPVERGDLPDNGDGAPIDPVGPGG